MSRAKGMSSATTDEDLPRCRHCQQRLLDLRWRVVPAERRRGRPPKAPPTEWEHTDCLPRDEAANGGAA
jgi:hypothetical protein